jgi:hypothetical protein
MIHHDTYGSARHAGLRRRKLTMEAQKMNDKLPGSVFDRIVETLKEYYGEGWTEDRVENRNFALGAQATFSEAESVHLIGDPEFEKGQIHFNLWIDTAMEDVLAADELAYALFAELADDIFACTRQIEERGVRYRFITGNGRDGHLGSIHFTGPNAMDFVHMYRLRGGRGVSYNA